MAARTEERFNYRSAKKGIFNKKCDSCLFIFTMGLVLVGVIMVYSTTAVVAPTGIDGNDGGSYELIDLRYLKKHVIALMLGMCMMAVFYKIDLDLLERISPYLFAFSIVFLLAVFIPNIGRTINGASRWLRLGGMTFQPSELVKLSSIILLARYLSAGNFSKNRFTDFLKPIILMLFIQTLLLLQPDFGTASILGALVFSLLFIAGVRMRYLMSTGIVIIPVIIKLIMEPYRLKRIMVFLDPWSDERGGGFQLVQSLIAFGSGGIQGVGIGKSAQKLFFLPEAKTDFIFSILGEELGLIGVTVVLLLFLLFFIRGLAIINNTKDKFLFYTSTGVLLMIVLQAFINMAVVTGLLPTKGLTLPFISYGGSSLMVNLMAVGLLLNISRCGASEGKCSRSFLHNAAVKRDVGRRISFGTVIYPGIKDKL